MIDEGYVLGYAGLDNVERRTHIRWSRPPDGLESCVATFRFRLEPKESAAFERLRALRRQLADRENVPAYVVFSDAVLREMARRLPRSDEELLAVPGVGPAKLQRYGGAFIDALRPYRD